MINTYSTEPPRTIRVLHIMSGFGGGISSFIKNKAQVMPHYNITFDVVTYDHCSDEFVATIQATGGDVYPLKNPKKEGWRAFKHTFTRVLAMYDYDVVHCHIDGYRVLPYYYYCQQYNIKRFYIHAHNAYRLDENIVKTLTTAINQYINRSTSQAIVGCGREAIRGVYGKSIAIQDMMMIPNSIDTQRFEISDHEREQYRQLMRKQYGFKESQFIIGQVGRFERVKNHNFTLDLAQYMKQNNLEGHFIFVGDGNLKSETQQEVIERGLSDYITVADRVSEIEKFYCGLDAIILPSLYEGFPTVVVEAQAAGVPVVMSDTITSEVELGLNMLTQLPLELAHEKWYQALNQTRAQAVGKVEERLEHLTMHNFSNYASGLLYAKFLQGEISSYRIN